jgi:heptosyltransferase II
MVSTDSGPAHLANALGTHTIVLFGAGKESNTAPYNKELRNIIRLGELSCEPCEKNVCVRYGIPQCLERLDTNRIIEAAKLHLN